jgi:hypothetical protein
MFENVDNGARIPPLAGRCLVEDVTSLAYFFFFHAASTPFNSAAHPAPRTRVGEQTTVSSSHQASTCFMLQQTWLSHILAPFSFMISWLCYKCYYALLTKFWRNSRANMQLELIRSCLVAIVNTCLPFARYIRIYPTAKISIGDGRNLVVITVGAFECW